MSFYPRLQFSLLRIIPRGVRSLQLGANTTKLRDNAHHSEPFAVNLDEESFHSFKCDPPSLEVHTTKDELLTMYSQMQVIRRMEMAADALYKARLIRGFCHLSTGQEAVSVGLEHGIQHNDRVISAYRCHPFVILRGGTVAQVFGELLGRQSGISHGKGGSMHMFTETFRGGHGIVGAHVPIGAGIALAQKYMHEPNVTFTLYGDGASNQGQVAEAFNMAKLWELPIVFICENNLYGMGTSSERSSANPLYYTRGDTIPGIQVNGMDIMATRQAVQHARKWVAEEKKGPLILEFVTYRYAGHSMSDPGTTYRSHEEVQQMRSTKDPIRGLQHYIQDWGLASEDELKEIEKESKVTVNTAIEEAKASPEPPDEDLWKDIYHEGDPNHVRRGREREEVRLVQSCEDLRFNY
ncbi:hypothetical protein H0H92_013734 [Tricholoma furcatifolium]|nr:hypothetical protein H0H92_013734 [Tricholoma furcatifolium]